jgi:predicted ester cyclase/ketosteroid isomerase-like protein
MISMRFCRTLIVWSVIFVAGCGSPRNESPTLAEVEEKLAEQWRIYVEGAKNEDIDLALSVWSTDLRLLGDPGGTEEIKGRDGYRQVMESAFPILDVVELTTDRAETLLLDSDDAIETGRWSETYRFDDTGETATYYGAYTILWRLEADGEWRIRRFIRNRHDSSELEVNKDLIRRFIAETDAKNWGSYNEFLSPQLVFHLSGNAPLDRVQSEENEKVFAAAFPDLTRSIDQLFAAGDRVLMRETLRGTHLGEFAGVSATGQSIEWTANVVYRIEDGKIAEIWGEADFGVLMSQIRPPSE